MDSKIIRTFSFTCNLLSTALLTLLRKPQKTNQPKSTSPLKILLKRKCKQIIYTLYFVLNANSFFRVYSLLHDEDSKALYKKLILFRLTGWDRIKIKDSLDWDHEQKIFNVIQQFDNGKSDLDLLTHPVFGPLNHYKHIPTETGDISLDTWAYSLMYVAFKKQYYFDHGKIKVKPEYGDVVIDAGGCVGDNAAYFAMSVGHIGHVHVFDPLPAHEKIIKKNINQNKLASRITYSSFALGKNSSNLAASNISKSHTLFLPDPTFHVTNSTEFPMITIDDYAYNNKLDKIDFIKMDIEGYEMQALQGAIETIKRFKPKLAISIYHKWQDFYVIPLWIHEIYNDYLFFIDHYTTHSGETILYAIAKDNALL